MAKLKRINSVIFVSTAFIVVLAGRANAADNNVYLGQTGVTNTINIEQAGLSNQVGANTTTLLLNQDGRENAVDIKQTGYANSVATIAHPLPSNAPYSTVALGINQVGNNNALSIEQSNSVASGTNSVEAVYQAASRDYQTLSNQLTVTQSGAGGSGVADQRVGEIIQINTQPGNPANTMTISQTGGGAGIGNDVESVGQNGYGNQIGITQSAASNEIGTVRQEGNGNEQTLQQNTGNGNIAGEALQRGDLNRLQAIQSGDSNYLLKISQNNAGVAISGNTARLVIVGDDNGGDGRGGLGRFDAIAADTRVAQATATQIGDDNDLSYTVGADVAGGSSVVQSKHNLFGFFQDGSGNGIIGATVGEDNEVAVAQRGDDNDFSFSQNGSANGLAVAIEGDRNRADVGQTGSGNIARIAISGAGSDSNNGQGLVFGGDLQTAAAAARLVPGRYRQSGSDNSFDLTIADGSSNLSAFLQSGSSNTISGRVSGSANQAVVIQNGSGNIAGFSQAGGNNRLIIQQ